MRCTRCGSQAINPSHHGRDGTRLDLCDVCYWRSLAEGTRQEKSKITEDAERIQFERWITAPPFERSIRRFASDDRLAAWSGRYCDNSVALAWKAWKASKGINT